MPRNVFDNIDMQELGRRLRTARRQQGMTQEDAANVIGVARTTIVAIESGTRRIRSEELLMLADAYDRRLNDLLRPLPSFESFQVQFRGPQHLTDDDREAIAPYIDMLEDLSRNYWELEQMLQTPNNQKYPSQINIQGLSVHLAAEAASTNERNRLGLGDTPIQILRNILEQDIGLRIFYFPFSRAHKFSEIYFYNDTLGGCIAINSLHPEERRRWSAAHAYGHFLAHRHEPSVLIEYWQVPESERFADDFAARFLMPTTSLTRQFNDITRDGHNATFAELFQLANYYGVSLLALLLRLEDMKLVPAGTAERAKQQNFRVNEVRQELKLAHVPMSDQKLPLRYQRLAIEAFENDLIGENRLASFLEVDVVHARRIAEVMGTQSETAVQDPDVLESQNP